MTRETGYKDLYEILENVRLNEFQRADLNILFREIFDEHEAHVLSLEEANTDLQARLIYLETRSCLKCKYSKIVSEEGLTMLVCEHKGVNEDLAVDNDYYCSNFKLKL